MEWLTILLAGCFYTHAKSFEAHKELFQRILRDAKRIGVVETRDRQPRRAARRSPSS